MTTFYDGDSSEVRKGSAYSKTVKGIRPSSESGSHTARRHRKIPKYNGNGGYIPHSSEFTSIEYKFLLVNGRTPSIVRQEVKDLKNVCESACENKDKEKLDNLLREISIFKRNFQIYRANPTLVEKELLRILPELMSHVNAIESKVNKAFSSASEEPRCKKTFGKARLYGLEDALKAEALKDEEE